MTVAVATALGGAAILAAPPANPTGAGRSAPAARTASAALPAAPAGEGLESLSDSALMTELSSRGIDNLLKRYFDIHQIPEAQQQAIKTMGAMGELTNPQSKIPFSEKIRRVKDIAEGIDAVLPSIEDPDAALKLANALYEYGVKRDVNNIEYWGEDPVTQGNLRPVADAVIKLMQKSGDDAQKQADKVANLLNGRPNPNVVAKWEHLDALAQTAAYNKDMSEYFRVLSLPAKDPQRKTIAEAAITSLRQYDTPDKGVQARVHNMIAKLEMLAGDSKAARKDYKEVFSDRTEIKPPPNPFEQYEARYFTVVNDLLSKNLSEAKADMASLNAWQSQVMPKLLGALKMADGKPAPAKLIEDNNKGVAAAGQMLQWRVYVLQGELAKNDPAARKKADDAAEAILLKLRDARPDLAPIIDQQLVARMPANKAINAQMAPSLLLALLKKGMIESYKTTPETPDPQILDKGIEAAKSIIARKGQAGIIADNVSEANLSIALLLEKLNKPVEAASQYLDFAVNFYKTSPTKATQALDRAGYMILIEMKKTSPAPAGYDALYDRFLPIAINPPFDHKDLALTYGNHLRDVKQYKDALKYYKMVPAEDPRYAAARYKIMLTLGDLLDTRQTPFEHKQAVSDLTAVAEEIRKLGEQPKNDFERGQAVQATLVLADLARIEQKDPKRTLEVLKNFDQLVKGLATGDTLLRNAQIARVNAYMQLGQTSEAVRQLTDLLKSAKGDDGINLIRALLDQLDKEYGRAVLAHNKDEMRVVARNEASLTHYLVDWSNPETQKDSNTSRFYYAYAVYDARTQRLAGSLSADPADRKKLLEQAQERYRTLLSRPMHDLYIQQPDVKKRIAAQDIDAADPDPSVQIGLALSDFDLGDYKDAGDLLGPLIAGKKLGTPQVEVVENGESKLKDNDLYWEATFKYLKSNYETAGNDAKAQNAVKQSLKNLLIRGGIPERWQEDYESLRKQLIPDFNPNGPAVAQPAVHPAATAPTARAMKK
ncbi:MAG TPA: hypothetical protein VFC78_10605 [Tepidisphaeraceae bacterium]|nr:hypothetical protein [Tepidisphaeraceae bacterium]